jgi:hypothetical protein
MGCRVSLGALPPPSPTARAIFQHGFPALWGGLAVEANLDRFSRASRPAGLGRAVAADLACIPVTPVTALAAFDLLSGSPSREGFQVMHTQKQHWLDYDPVALAVLVLGLIGLLALTI